jgi:large subunit ribosomal protein L19e
MQNLDKRKKLASKVFGVGTGRICFDETRLAEIKEAITKQDIKDLYASGAISIKEISGRQAYVKRKTKRGPGKIKLKIRPGKRHYIHLTRKLRRHIKELKIQGKIQQDLYLNLRKKIKAREFKDKSHLKEHLTEIKIK